MPASSVDAVVTDPPYAIRGGVDPLVEHRLDGDAGRVVASCADCNEDRVPGFSLCRGCLDEAELQAFTDRGMLGMQSANWHDKATHSRGYADNNTAQFQRWCFLWAVECHRVLKPGGHIVAFGGTRTWHRLACAIEDAGFEIRDSLAWLYSTGFPKSVNLHQPIADLRAERRRHPGLDDGAEAGGGLVDGAEIVESIEIDGVATHDWSGWGTGLKPSHEPIVLARKRPVGTVARNLLDHGTGAMNLAASRLSSGDGQTRWPANVFLDEDQARVLDGGSPGLASRFFYVAKPSPHERVQVEGLSHPTVKPLNLMRYLLRLVAPVGGVVLDPFVGSGTTMEACLLEGFTGRGVEQDPSYVPLIEQRLRRRTLLFNAATSSEHESDEPMRLF